MEGMEKKLFMKNMKGHEDRHRVTARCARRLPAAAAGA